MYKMYKGVEPPRKLTVCVLYFFSNVYHRGIFDDIGRSSNIQQLPIGVLIRCWTTETTNESIGNLILLLDKTPIRRIFDT